MTDFQKDRVGIIGMGIMGQAMARNARKAGFDVTVYNRTRSKAELLVSDGVTVASSPKTLSEQSDIIVTMVTGPSDVKSVLEGPSGILSIPCEGKLLIQMSTLDVESTLAIAELVSTRSLDFLDCPVAGSKKQVQEAQLILLAGGTEKNIRRAEPFLKSVGKAIVHAGDVGKGTALKLCMNLIVAQMTTALCESVALAKILEIDPEKIFDVIGHSPALNCGYFNIKKSTLLKNDFSPAFSLSNMLKDVRFMDQAAKHHKLPLPVTQAVRFLMEGAVVAGFGEQDLTAISNLLWPKHRSTSGVKN